MNSVANDESRRTEVWYRSKRVFVASAMLLTLLVVSVYVGASSLRQEESATNLSTFICHDSSGNQTFTVTVEVNVVDGMDKDEAILVATNVGEQVVEPGVNYKLTQVSAESVRDEHGIWAVHISLTFTLARGSWVTRFPQEGAILRRSFSVAIDPFNLTVSYSGQ